MQYASYINKIIYYKSLWDSNWCENDNNWYVFIQRKFCVWSVERTKKHATHKILFWITNMTTYYYLSFYIKITITKWFVQYFSSYLCEKDDIFSSILLTTYKIIKHINKLARKYNLFTSITWKNLFNIKLNHLNKFIEALLCF